MTAYSASKSPSIVAAKKSPLLPLTRTRASLYNLVASVFGQIVTVLVNFVCRKYLIEIIGNEYMGLASLFGHIMSFLSLIEPGFAAAVIFSYYRPIAEGNVEKCASLNAYLEKICLFCALFTCVMGFVLAPHLEVLADIPQNLVGTRRIFILTVINLASGYLYFARRAYVFASMQGFVITLYHTVFLVVSSVARIFLLYVSKSYCVYIAAGIILGLLEDILLHVYVGIKYPFLKKQNKKLEIHDKKEIKNQVGALFFHRLGAIITGSADNLCVMAFMGLSAGTFYSNYTLISGSLMSFISLAAGSVSASLGNLGALGNRPRMKSIFIRAMGLIFAVSLILAPMLYFAYPKIIGLWVGEQYILDSATTFFFCLSFFILVNRSVLLVFRDALGLYKKEILKPFCEVAANLSLTLYLTPRMGIKGVIIGQIAGMVCCLIWEMTIVFSELSGDDLQ